MPKYLSRRRRLLETEALALGLLPVEGVRYWRIVVPGSGGVRLDVSSGPKGTFVRNLDIPDGYLRANSAQMQVFLRRTVQECGILRMDTKTADRLGAMQNIPGSVDISLSQKSGEVVLTYLGQDGGAGPSLGLGNLGLSAVR